MLKELLYIPAVLARNIKAATTHPSNVRHARITAVLWAIATGSSWLNIGTDIIAGDYHFLDFPWIVLIPGVALMDAVMLRWALIGHTYALTRRDEERRTAADREEFESMLRAHWDD